MDSFADEGRQVRSPVRTLSKRVQRRPRAPVLATLSVSKDKASVSLLREASLFQKSFLFHHYERKNKDVSE